LGDALTQLEGDGLSAIGLTFLPGAVTLPPLDELEGAERNSRVLAAVIGSLSVLAQKLRDSLAPEIPAADWVAGASGRPGIGSS
jgi:hypothetical protein